MYTIIFIFIFLIGKRKTVSIKDHAYREYAQEKKQEKEVMQTSPTTEHLSIAMLP